MHPMGLVGGSEFVDVVRDVDAHGCGLGQMVQDQNGMVCRDACDDSLDGVVLEASTIDQSQNGLGVVSVEGSTEGTSVVVAGISQRSLCCERS